MSDTSGGTFDRIVAAAQSERRLPSVSAAVFRAGEVVWQGAVGLADVEREGRATPDHAYRIGSITKTFTAVCVLALRDAGLVELDAGLGTYVRHAPAGPTVRQALTHLSGLQREPPGDIWETLDPPGRDELLESLAEAEQILAPGELWHYSNLAFALLGEVVTAITGERYPDHLRRAVLDPLGLARTGFAPAAPAAQGYYVGPYTDQAHPEPDLVLDETAAALGQLWSTTGDLAAWGDFLACGREGVLARETLDEMARVQVMADERGWTSAWGLGVELCRRGERVFAAHGGAMPGFLAGLVVERASRTGAVVLANATTDARAEDLALDLAAAALDAYPDAVAEWRPNAGPAPDIAPLLGQWWIEGSPLVLSYRDGRLQAELPDGPPGRNVAWLAREGEDSYRVVEGYEHGELLRVVRDAEGAVVKLSLATYPVTRAPTTFSGSTAP